jgi:hypothetical protein
MNCHEARERLSGFLDEALDAPELTEIRAHLEGCLECRRELERLRGTVSLLSRVERPRAPAGFVDRVMAAARPMPWYRRLGHWLFLPLGIKLPAEAAAMVMIGVLGVFLLQRTPEMQEAARPELRSPAYRSEAPRGRNAELTTSKLEAKNEPGQKELKGGEADSRKVGEQAPRVAREAEKIVGDERRPDSARSSPPASEELKQQPQRMPELKDEGDVDRLQKPGAPTSQVAPAPPAAVPSAPVPAAPPSESRAKSRDAAEGQSGALAPGPSAPSPPAASRPEMSGKRQPAVSGLFGRLNVKDRPSAEKGLADLLSRLGGSETRRRQEQGATVVEVLVPEARHAEFVRGLTTLGAWTAEGQPTALPTDPPRLRLTIRISE